MADLPWLKLWAEMLDDPKMAGLSDRDFRIWIELLMAARRHASEEGVINLPHDRIAWLIRRPVHELEAALGAFADLGLISCAPERTTIAQWRERQYGKPSAAPSQIRKRVQVHRGRNAVVTPLVTRDVTRKKRASNTTESESELEEETETTTSSPVVADATPVASNPPPIPVLIPSEPEWPPDLADVRKALDALQAPEDLHDPPFWRGIDEWLGKHPRVAYLDELAKYLTWWRAQSGRKRHRKLKAGFRNWLNTSENRDEREAQRRHQLDERPGSQRRR